MQAGTLSKIHRYPVKSMLGESLDSSRLGEKGIPGDRAWAVRDEARGGIQGGKKIPGLMSCAARYAEAAEPGSAPEIRLPAGDVFPASDPDAAGRISEAVGREVTLWPLLPADAVDHYRRSAPDNPDFEQELRTVFGREPGEPLPDITKFPPELFEYESPPGTYFDAFPLLLVTTQSLASLAEQAPDSLVDMRRFRPNLVVDTTTPGPFPEQEWIGKRLHIGSAVVKIEMECPRCVMTTHGFADVPKDPRVMRTLVQKAAGNFGVYATVETPGDVACGAPVVLS